METPPHWRVVLGLALFLTLHVAWDLSRLKDNLPVGTGHKLFKRQTVNLSATVYTLPVVRRYYVKRMMVHAWSNYVQYAMGQNELRPLSRQAHLNSVFGPSPLGVTVVDALDTLYIMGLSPQYNQARDWVEQNLTVDDINAYLPVFETNIRFIGGLLSIYSLTGDTMFRDKAQQIADKLMPAFETKTGIPLAIVHSKTGKGYNYGWANNYASILAEVGTLHLEFSYLSDVTGDPKYRAKVENVRQVIRRSDKNKGLTPIYLDPATGQFNSLETSLGAMGDSFFEYLLKSYLQSNRSDDAARQMFVEAIRPVVSFMLRRSAGGLYFFTDLYNFTANNRMDHLACFAGGMFALAAQTSVLSPTYLRVAAEVARTCRETYRKSITGLGPDNFYFTSTLEAMALRSSEKAYLLRPELVESYFYLWRFTKEQKYRDWGWEIVIALEQYCRVPCGYSGIRNVYSENPQYDDVQQSFFLAETLKYLYLLYSDDWTVPLDKWVFNTEAHPLPIKGVNPLYRAKT